MCGVYHIDEDNAELIRVLSSALCAVPDGKTLKTGDIFPGDAAPVLTANRAEIMRWGFALDGKKGRIINAKSETALEKPLFRPLVLDFRCAIPASRYYEWETLAGGRRKYAISPENGETVYLAGLYRHIKYGLPEFVVLTRRPENNISFIHDRMPLLLENDARDEWLFSENAALMLENLADFSAKVVYAPFTA